MVARVTMLAAGLLLAAPGGAAADVALSTDRTAANVSAHGGQLVWARVGRDGRSRLVRRVRGVNRDVPVPPKEGLFDPDTGVGRGGRQQIVYTRCAGLSGAGCDIWRYDDRIRRERKVRGASSRRCSEFAPSIWRRTIAFGRSGPGDCPGLYVVRRGRLRRLGRRVPAQTDVRGLRVAYLYAPAASRARTSVWLRTIGHGRSRRVVSGFAAERESYRVTSPVLAGGFVYWLQEDRVRDEFFFGRGSARRPSSLEFTRSTYPGRVTAIAVGAGRVYYANGRGLHRATDPGFAARD